MPSSIACTSPPRVRITRPRTPASATSTFDPPPSIVTGTPAARAIDSAASISSLLRVSISQSAGPPTRNVVSGASGAPACRRSAPNAARIAAAKSLTIGRSSTAISARSCAISAAIASAGVQTANAIVSPGAS